MAQARTKRVRPTPTTVDGTQLEAPVPQRTLLDVLQHGDEDEIKARVASELRSLLPNDGSLTKYCILWHYEPGTGITRWNTDRIYQGLRQANGDRQRDILLFLVSPGGEIEPGYQISKICKAFAHNKFVVAVPRQAKSAATLLSLGADEIHMGILGELGPIDPQIGGMPALGVVQALETLASITQNHPASGEMLSRFLRDSLTVEQIGYCERVSVSAQQYAERLLANKSTLPAPAGDIAHKLVYDYKDHGFVIDPAEASEILGNSFVITKSSEVAFAEDAYAQIEFINLLLSYYHRKHVHIVGGLDEGIWYLDD